MQEYLLELVRKNKPFSRKLFRQAECPYCGKKLNISDNHNNLEEGWLYNDICCYCEKNFVFYVKIYFFNSVEFITKTAPCLNGQDHNWEKFNYRSNLFKCKYCGKLKEKDK